MDGITDAFDIANLFANNIYLLLNSNSPESWDAMHGSIKSSLLAAHIKKGQSIS